jgi:hypothetical protein
LSGKARNSKKTKSCHCSHFQRSRDADPDPTIYFDADPDTIFLFYADPDPTLYFDADTDPIVLFDVDQDPTLYFDADPDPIFLFDAVIFDLTVFFYLEWSSAK